MPVASPNIAAGKGWRGHFCLCCPARWNPVAFLRHEAGSSLRWADAKYNYSVKGIAAEEGGEKKGRRQPEGMPPPSAEFYLL